MKICIVTRNIMKGDGQSRVNYEIAWEAIRCGHDVTMLASSVDLELQQSPQAHWIEIQVQKWPTQILGGLAFSWQCARWLARHRAGLDVVMVNGANTNERSDINAVHFVHTSWLRSHVHPWQLRRDLYGAYQWLFSALNAYWEKKAFQKTNIVVAVSEKVKQELLNIGVPSDRIRVILNGVDLHEFSPGTSDRLKLGLPEGVTLALFVGDILTSRKNLDSVLRALVNTPDLHLAVAGTTEGSPFPKLVSDLNLSQRVHFLGFRRDVSELMKGADFFVFPSRYEACTLVLLEAIASGLPVITANSAGGAEIITPDCGIVLPDSEDIQALAEALTKLASDRNQRDRMGHAARAIAERHSWTSIAQKYVEIFEELTKVQVQV
ncbi:glycosyltransferase family 4 protein [Tumidithrix elongata RA019]|uniref:Glycosyltransferase family 4 protein n=1 Tax=Tumidithrix elongata BACA0141 TaxID=2716417 RepID=A0AAW9PR67_9CYAN|nr:glycosyltransferase family 4 protein [Tumidithrix elongata RA019]